MKTSVEVKAEEAERYMCPFKDCRSESKNAQSIKVHLALVYYKKLIVYHLFYTNRKLYTIDRSRIEEHYNLGFIE